MGDIKSVGGTGRVISIGIVLSSGPYAERAEWYRDTVLGWSGAQKRYVERFQR